MDTKFIPTIQGAGYISDFWFMQDGARPHRTSDVFELLAEHFDTIIIALDAPAHVHGGIEWPPYSPDLNPCDFSLWGYYKSKVWETNPKILQELEKAIFTVIRSIPQ